MFNLKLMRSTWLNELTNRMKSTRLTFYRIRHIKSLTCPIDFCHCFLVLCLFLTIQINQIECSTQALANQTQNDFQTDHFSIPFSSSSTSTALDSDHQLVLNQSSPSDLNVLIMNRSQYLESMMGQRYKSIEFVVFMGTIYSLILLCGILGNLSTCFVVIMNTCLHTTTNYYLFSLAMSDVLLLLSGLPPEMYNIFVEAYPWPTGQTFCVLRTFIFELTTIASVLTILTFTFERWLHICKAIYAKKFSSGFSRALKIIIFIWLISGLLALPYLFTSGVYFEEHEYPESKLCGILKKYKDFMVNIIQLSVVFLFIVPMTLISIMYVLIGVTLWRSHAKKRAQARQTKSRSLSLKLNGFFKLKKKDANGHKQQHTQQQAQQESLMKKSETNECLSKSSVSNECKLKRNHSKSIPNISINYMNSEYDINRELNGSKRRTTTALGPNKQPYDERTSKDFEHISYRTRQSRRDVVKMLFVVVLAFFTSWAPYHLQRVLTASIDASTVKSQFVLDLLETLYYISGVSIYISSTLNPILYNVMSKRYRTAFKNTLKMIMSCSFKSYKANQNLYKNSAFYYNSTINSTKQNTLISTTNRHSQHLIATNRRIDLTQHIPAKNSNSNIIINKQMQNAKSIKFENQNI